MFRKLLLAVTLLFLFAGCAAQQSDLNAKYPKKPDDTSERKAGRAMFFYEQAEKDLDVNDSVIVVAPKATKKTTQKSSSEIE